jgi:hypothetical protein
MEKEGRYPVDILSQASERSTELSEGTLASKLAGYSRYKVVVTHARVRIFPALALRHSVLSRFSNSLPSFVNLPG